MSPSPQPTKDTIYIDAEDEITAIIEKVRASSAKVVALVLPKRAATLQSIVNLKLLKRTSKEAKKSLVLITSDPNLLALAGAVEIHVAKTLQTKPEVPEIPKATSAPNSVVDAGEAPELATPAGQLAGHVATEETIELDNDAKDTISDKKVEKTKKGLNKKLRVPDFNRFRVLLFGGIALIVLLIVGSIFAFIILPKASITIKTDTNNVNIDQKIIARVDAKGVDQEAKVVPAIKKDLKKTDKEKVPATGQRDEGNKATGTMTITNCGASVLDLPAGTVFSSGDKKFVSNDLVSVPKSGYSFTPDGFVCDNDGFKNVAVTAQSGGGSYNLTARSYTIEGGGANVTAKGSAMSGGTSKLVQIVSQGDIDNAKQKVLDRLNPIAVNELRDQFTTSNATALSDTFAAGSPVIASAPNVNDPSTEVTVTVTVTFTELGVKKDDLKQLVETEAKKSIDASKQVIQDNGIDKASIQMIDKKPTEATFQFKTIVVAGPQLDAEGIKREVAGKKKKQTEDIIKGRPGIRDVDINYSPFWVFSTPKNASHITVTFDQNNADK